MKRIMSVLSIVATSVLLSTSPLLAAEAVIDKNSVKDECLLVAMNCGNVADSYQTRIERLNKEIAKGTDVYTRDELRKLSDKLEEATRALEALTTS